MLPHSRTRLPASLRNYATRAAQKTPDQTPKPSGSSLRARLVAAQVAAATRRQAKPTRTGRTTNAEMTQEERDLAAYHEFQRQSRVIRAQGRTPPPILVPLMDLMIPYSVGFKARSEYPSIRAAYRQFVNNRVNDGKNAFSMRHIAMSDAFPGVEMDQSMGLFRGMYTYAKNVFKAQSLKSNAWVAPLRQEALERYIKLNQAMTQKSPRIADLTADAYQAELTEILRKRDPEHLYRWNFHREVTPTRILSLRAADGHYGKDLPETGCRVALQALVRFDTEQSVEIYDKLGRALHTPAASPLVDDGEAPQPPRLGSKALQIVPAQRRRVTEYLVLNKAMYLPGAQWQFRARFVPTPGRTVAI